MAISGPGLEGVGEPIWVWVKIFGWRFQGGDYGYRNLSDDICMAVWGREVKIFVVVENIWVAILG